MRKFLSICVITLCSVYAMYAQNSVQKIDSVSCGTNVSVQATSKDGFYHFVVWKIENGNDTLGTVAKDGSVSQGNGYGATVSDTIDGTSGVETSTLTLNSLNDTLIDAATTGTVTFEAFFDIDSYTIKGIVNDSTMGSVSGSGTTTGSTSVTLTATVNQNATCARFDHWEDENGNTVDGNVDNPNQLTVTPQATWAHGSTHTYKAVFVTKTININVKSSDTNMGTVTIIAPSSTSTGN